MGSEEGRLLDLMDGRIVHVHCKAPQAASIKL